MKQNGVKIHIYFDENHTFFQIKAVFALLKGNAYNSALIASS